MVRPDPLPSLIAIRAFEAAARLGGFARAGAELGTSAAAVSYHVRRLEQEMDATLFRRLPHRVELTPAGATAATAAGEAFTMLAASFGRARAIGGTRLSISCLPSFGAGWLAPRLGAFRARRPDLIAELDLSPVARDLMAGDCDVAIRNGHGDWPRLRSERLFPSLFQPLCAPALRDALAEPHTPGAPLLGRADWWRLWYMALGQPTAFRADRLGLGLPDEHLDVAAAVAGHGVVIASPILFANEVAAGRLVSAHPLVAGDGRAFWLVTRAARPSERVAAFRDWLRAEAACAVTAAEELIARTVMVPTRRDVSATSEPLQAG